MPLEFNRMLPARLLPFFTAALALIVGSVGAFTGGIWAETGIIGAIVIYLGVWTIERRAPRPDRSFSILAGALLAWMVVSALISVHPAISWFQTFQITSFLLPLLLLTCPAILQYLRSPKLFPVVPIVIAVAAAALALELYLGAPVLRFFKGPQAAITEYDRGFSYLVVFFFPFLAWLWVSGRRAFAIGLLAIILVPASLTYSRSAKIALIAGFCVCVCVYFLPILSRRCLTLVLFCLIGWPFAVRMFFLKHFASLSHLPNSWRDRVEIWDYLSYRITERPILGWGMGTSRTLDFIHPHGALYVIRTEAAPHPHNVVIQLWVEMGIGGIALGLAFALLTLHKISRLDRSLVPFATGAWTAALCLSLISYNFWTDSFFATFALTGLMFALLNGQDARPLS